MANEEHLESSNVGGKPTQQVPKPHKAMVLYEKDPLLRFLIERLNLSLLAIIVLVVAVGALSFYGIGAVVSYLVYKGANIIRVFDPENIYFSLVATFVNTPLIWLVYVWQPRGIANVLDSLRQNHVIVEMEEGSLETFMGAMKASLDSYRLSIAAVLAVSFFVSVQTFVVFPAESERLGASYFWFYDKRYYFLLFTPVLSLSYYAVAMVALKGALAFFWLNQLFRRFRAKVLPLHPDGAGGFGSLGSLAIRYGLIAVGLGAMAAAVTVARILIGSGWAYLDVLILYALYIILAPISLVTPLWSAHQAMVRARNEVLYEISKEFEQVLRQPQERLENTEMLDQSWARLEKLKSRYTLIRNIYPTWPISFSALRRFSITAMLPLITGVGSVLIDYITGSVLR